MRLQQANKSYNGFTLLELSIVLTIVGLILASISVSAALIRQAEVRSIINELQMYKTAFYAFKVAYDKTPGDMSDATNFFNVAECEVTVDACNGDGNGKILYATDDTDEVRAAMKHLSLARLIDKPIDPITSDGTTALVIGKTAPKSKFQGGGYMLVNQNAAGNLDIGGAVTPPFDDKINALYLGGVNPVAGEILSNGTINGYYAYSIDKKIDDGMVSGNNTIGFNTGDIRVINSAASPNCILAGVSYIVEKPVGNSCLLGYAME